MTTTHTRSRPGGRDLYDPVLEKDSCGVGFVAHLGGRRSHQLLQDADELLRRMSHRGACGCEPNTGDGAGILTALPHELLVRAAREKLGAELPAPGRYGAGLVFLPRSASARERCKRVVESVVAAQGQRLLGWRRVPTAADAADIGPSARAAEPHMEHLVIAADEGTDASAFERRLYLIRKQLSHRLPDDGSPADVFYICSLSTKIWVYKGMLTPEQLFTYFPDLSEPDYSTHLAMVHSRFSTNTMPSWDRAQPNRFTAHNGEINTLRGNINWMRAREGVLGSRLFGSELESLFPVVEPGCSDSGSVDNVLEFLRMTGRTLQEAMAIMIPEAWQNDRAMPADRRAFYEYHSCLMEPWDGPASITFTDGDYIGAVLDRNGLRPSRYYVTRDDRIILASEVGALPVDAEDIEVKGRLQPGRMLLVDFDQGRIVPDEELKAGFAADRPYADWLERGRIELGGGAPGSDPAVDAEAGEARSGAEQAPASAHPTECSDAPALRARMRALGYTRETLRFMLLPLLEERRDPVGAMGNDAALACLSERPRMLYDYFKQLFAQVTNPPIDSIREEVVMSLACYVGPERNLLEPGPEHCERLLLPHPILTDAERAGLDQLDRRGWSTRTLDITYPRERGTAGMTEALDRICAEAEAAVDDGHPLIVLSDRGLGPDRVPVSALMACGAVHHHLVRRAKRSRIGIVLETGEPREVHHHCLLLGYGADAIHPYLAYQALWQARRDDLLDPDVFPDDASVVAAYRKGVGKGILKVMAKMGISTLQSYKGAQIFEALGLSDAVVDRCFAGTSSRLRGVGFETLAGEALHRHALGYPAREKRDAPALPNPGLFQWRAGGERHQWAPAVITELQAAARSGDPEAYHRFSERVNRDARSRSTLRGLLELRDGANGGPVALEDVEPARNIVGRFCTGAMSFGSLSAEAHETLAVAMNRLGGKSNTGEGGEDPARYRPLPDGSTNPRRSAIKQVASGRFGVTIGYLSNADELQIKMAQGAKPGEGGQLPGHKVDETIARVRHSTAGVGLISPPPHHDIYSIEDLAQLIYDLKNANPSARVSVKLVSEVGVGTIAAGVAKARADAILISGHDGGTGASPRTSIKHAGLPWELGLAEVHQTLVLNDLRSRVALQTDGGLKTGRDIVIAALLGAEEFGFSTAPLIALGCIMMRKCNLNTCPVGITTQDPELRRKFAGQPEHVVNYLFMVAEEARSIMARLGFRTMDQMIGRVDALEAAGSGLHRKAEQLDLGPILSPARRPREDVEVRSTREQDHGLEEALDNRLIALAKPALDEGADVRIELPVGNVNRAVGTMLSHELVRRRGDEGLPPGTIRVELTGSGGQSFGAFLARGITLELEGDANDYVGKGLSGGTLLAYPPRESTFAAEEHVLIGNVALYGATSGYAFFRGRAAERFGVRNSGAWAVVEGIGDHGCEYMTGGRVAVLGPTGRNFGAGMSGGIAYVRDVDGEFAGRCNRTGLELDRLESERDAHELWTLLQWHRRYTDSPVAARILDAWPESAGTFIKVIPTGYKRMLELDDGPARPTRDELPADPAAQWPRRVASGTAEDHG